MGDRTVVRQGLVGLEMSCRAFIVVVVALIAVPWAQQRASAQDAPARAPKEAPKEPIELRPYRISMHVTCDPTARIDEPRRAELLREWQVLVRRFVGTPWVLSLGDATSPLLNNDLDSIQPAAFASFTSFDKVWLVRIVGTDAGGSLELFGREYDTATRRLGPIQRRTVTATSDAPRELLEFSLDLFNPTAEITGQEGGRALLTVQGGALAAASPIGAIVAKGMVFQPLRLVELRDGTIQILRIPFTYLQVESVSGPVARCAITSALRDPFTKRMSRPNSLGALGLKPGTSPLALRFVTKPDQLPAAGYMLTARQVPDGQPRELGMTDRTGRIVLKPGFASGLVVLRLLAGNVEPMVELPIMPGESATERVIPFDPKPQTVALEAQIDSLRDEVVDLVALRARLESRMKARLEGEDWEGLEQAIKEFAQLTPKDDYARRLAKLKDDAAHEQAELKTAILTKTAQAQVNDLQSMIDRYLDDEIYHAYSDQLEGARKGADSKAKAQAKKAAQSSLASPLNGAPKAAPAAKPAPAPAAKTAGQAPTEPSPKPRPAQAAPSNVPF
jgi:hypothetical protein